MSDRETDAQSIKRALDAIHCVLSDSEKRGIGFFVSLNGLVKGEIVSLVVTNDITYVTDGSKKFELKIEANKTLIDLKILIADKVGCSWDQVSSSSTPVTCFHP